MFAFAVDGVGLAWVLEHFALGEGFFALALGEVGVGMFPH